MRPAPGHMMALSALMGRFSGAEGLAVSMMTWRTGSAGHTSNHGRDGCTAPGARTLHRQQRKRRHQPPATLAACAGAVRQHPAAQHPQSVRRPARTSWFCAPVSRTQTNLSLSMVTLVKVMALCCTPRLWSCRRQAGGCRRAAVKGGRVGGWGANGASAGAAPAGRSPPPAPRALQSPGSNHPTDIAQCRHLPGPIRRPCAHVEQLAQPDGRRGGRHMA